MGQIPLSPAQLKAQGRSPELLPFLPGPCGRCPGQLRLLYYCDSSGRQASHPHSLCQFQGGDFQSPMPDMQCQQQPTWLSRATVNITLTQSFHDTFAALSFNHSASFGSCSCLRARSIEMHTRLSSHTDRDALMQVKSMLGCSLCFEKWPTRLCPDSTVWETKYQISN